MFDQERLRAIVAAMAGKRLAVVGDVMVDRFVRGTVERISPEAPVPVVRVRREQNLPGGAANVARNLAAMGARPEIVSVIGDDADGDRLLNLLADMGCSTSCLVRDPERQTTVKTRVVAHHQQVVRFDRETLAPLDPESNKLLEHHIIRLLPAVDGVIVSDYGKGVVNEALFRLLVENCRELGVFVAVDPKVKNFNLYRRINLMTPNTMEASQACGFPLDSPAAVRRAGTFIQRRFSCDNVIITRGEQGMAVFPAAGELLELPTAAREVFDVTGAGDTVIALASLASLVAGVSLEEAAAVANLAAGVVVGKVGTAPVSAGEILACYARRES